MEKICKNCEYWDVDEINRIYDGHAECVSGDTEGQVYVSHEEIHTHSHFGCINFTKKED